MAGELGQKQFIDNEVKPLVRKKIPSMLERLVSLENALFEVLSSADKHNEKWEQRIAKLEARPVCSPKDKKKKSDKSKG